MSRSPYFFVERFNNHTGKYELQHPIVWNDNHTKQELADLFPYNGCHSLFAILEEKEMNGIHKGLPRDVCEDIYKAYHAEDEYEGEHHMPTAHWFTYADMYIYCLEHPKEIDYEAMSDEEVYKDNSMFTLKNRVDAFMEVIDGWDWRNDYSQIRIVYWIF